MITCYHLASYISNLLSVDVLVQRILNYYPNYPTHRIYLGEVETPYRSHDSYLSLFGIDWESDDVTKTMLYLFFARFIILLDSFFFQFIKF